MQRVDNSTAVQAMPAIPAAGTPGFFTGGDPASSTPATVIPVWFLNMLQEELYAIVLAGGLTPDKANLHQVRDAIAAMIAAAINNVVAGAPVALDTLKELADAINDDQNFAASVTQALGARALASRQITGAGLATGGGDLTQDRQISVPKASSADIGSGARDDAAVTPAGLAGAIGNGSGGHVMLPGGLILQWGHCGLTDNSGFTDVVFPIPFPNNCFNVVTCNDSGSAENGGAVAWTAAGNPTKTGVRISMVIASLTPAQSGAAAFWQAIGN